MGRRLSPEVIDARMGLAKLYAVFMQPTAQYAPDSFEGNELMLDHLSWLFELEDEGRLYAAGPLKKLAGVAGTGPAIDVGGMFVIGAESLKECEEIAAQEPFFVAGWRTYTICRLVINEGRGIPLAREISQAFG